MGHNLFKPKSELEILEILNNQDPKVSFRFSFIKKYYREIKWLLDNRRDELDKESIERLVFKIIGNDDSKMFRLFQETEIVYGENYLKYINWAAGYSFEITKLLLEYPITNPAELYININNSIEFAKRHNRHDIEIILNEYLIENN